MLKIMTGTTVALASLLLLGACTTTGLRELGTHGGSPGASSASPATSIEPGPKLDGPFDLSEFPQTL
ncbi:MAG: hypothetical protein ACREK6_11155 [Candidatus Rokuibacteriota bacterium]